MAADRFLRDVSGDVTEVAGTQVSAGAGNAGDIVALGDDGYLDESLFPSGIGADTQQIEASENLSAGDFVNVWDDTGDFKVRKADAATAKRAHGFVLDAATSGNPATVYFEGRNNQLSGVTPGTLYLSATVPGGFQTSEPTGSGQYSQQIGTGVAEDTINFEPARVIVKL